MAVHAKAGAKTSKLALVQRFQAVLEKGEPSLGWTTAKLPFDPKAIWKTMVRLRVRGSVNGFAFRTSLFPDPRGGFFLLLNKAVQRGSGARLGAVADFELQPDLEERPAELPEMLAELLDEEPGMRSWYDELSEYTRREIGKWCVGVKGEEAQLRRVQQMAERLLATMEGERELPPAIEAAFRRRPKARDGWAKMTDVQRRNEIMAVFYYQSPEAREKRIGKLVEAAEKRGASRPADRLE